VCVANQRGARAGGGRVGLYLWTTLLGRVYTFYAMTTFFPTSFQFVFTVAGLPKRRSVRCSVKTARGAGVP
jgi:hypothetical protein